MKKALTNNITLFFNRIQRSVERWKIVLLLITTLGDCKHEPAQRHDGDYKKKAATLKIKIYRLHIYKLVRPLYFLRPNMLPTSTT